MELREFLKSDFRADVHRKMWDDAAEDYVQRPLPDPQRDEFLQRILRRGWATFSEISPEQEMASGYRLWGFVLGTPHGDYVVARHNRAISREKIAELRIEVQPPRQ